MNTVMIVPTGIGCEIGSHRAESVGLCGNFNSSNHGNNQLENSNLGMHT